LLAWDDDDIVEVARYLDARICRFEPTSDAVSRRGTARQRGSAAGIGGVPLLNRRPA
jgi:hypothetical protein